MDMKVLRNPIRAELKSRTVSGRNMHENEILR